MKANPRKISEAQVARLAAVTASREAGSATRRVDAAKVVFKKARKAYKQARKAAKRATKRAKQAQKKFAPLAKYLKQSKLKTPRKPQAKRLKLKSELGAKRIMAAATKSAVDAVSLAPPVIPSTTSSPANPPPV